MKNYIMLDGKKIPLSQETEQSLREVQEQNYEIIKTKKGKILITWKNGEAIERNDGFDPSSSCSLEQSLKYGSKIISVRRLSDGEVFTVGDKYKNISGIFTITGFRITSNNYMLVDGDPFGSCGLDAIQKVKQPLFTTEDGVDIFEGDSCYELIKNSNTIYSVSFGLSELKKSIANGTRLAFSTKEKAQEYIDLHKPKYSLADIERALKNVGNCGLKHTCSGTEHTILLTADEFLKELKDIV